ncbi:MAG: von Willebrand factor type A domain-containing protein [Planctomycetota bacterium]
MNHDDPRLTQRVLGEEKSAEMTEALNADPALQQEAEALQATADRMARALARPAADGSQAFAAAGPPRREPPTVLARLGGSLGVGIAAAVAVMVVWIGPGSNESMGPMASAAACCIADQCVELSPVECDDAGGQQYGQACQVQVCVVRAPGMVRSADVPTGLAPDAPVAFSEQPPSGVCCFGLVVVPVGENDCLLLGGQWSSEAADCAHNVAPVVEIAEEEAASESPEIAPAGGLNVAVDASMAPPPAVRSKVGRSRSDGRGGAVPSPDSAVGAGQWYAPPDAFSDGARDRAGSSNLAPDTGPTSVFLAPLESPLSTFGLDVDTMGMGIVRRQLGWGQRPPVDAIRIEEMVNFYDYTTPAPPTSGDALAMAVEVAAAPWNLDHRLVRIGISAEEIDASERPAVNLVLLVDTSGSMNSGDKLQLVQATLRMLADQLREDDRVSIVTYAGSASVPLSEAKGNETTKILAAINAMRARGSTAGAAGIQTAYDLARRNVRDGAVSRVLLFTDGDFNVGPSSQDELVQLVEQERGNGIGLSVFGYGASIVRDDRMETLSNHGDGVAYAIDTLREARRVVVQELTGTLFTVAKDAKIQVEFNPAKVAAYRLIGYDNRRLADQDFNDDTKDAGDLGAGHTVTALYEVVPVGVSVPGAPGAVDDLKYQRNEEPAEPSAAELIDSPELLTAKLRWKPVGQDESVRREQSVVDPGTVAGSEDHRFAAAVAALGLKLSNDPHTKDMTFMQLRSMAVQAAGDDAQRQGLLELVDFAKAVLGED